MGAPVGQQGLERPLLGDRQVLAVVVGRLEQHVQVANGTEPRGDLAEPVAVSAGPLAPERVAEHPPRRPLPAGRDAHPVELLEVDAHPGPRLAGQHPGEMEAQDLPPGFGDVVLGGDAGGLADDQLGVGRRRDLRLGLGVVRHRRGLGDHLGLGGVGVLGGVQVGVEDVLSDVRVVERIVVVERALVARDRGLDLGDRVWGRRLVGRRVVGRRLVDRGLRIGRLVGRRRVGRFGRSARRSPRRSRRRSRSVHRPQRPAHRRRPRPRLRPRARPPRPVRRPRHAAPRESPSTSPGPRRARSPACCRPIGRGRDRGRTMPPGRPAAPRSPGAAPPRAPRSVRRPGRGPRRRRRRGSARHASRGRGAVAGAASGAR